MSLEKSLGRLNRCFLVLVLLAVGLLALRAFQRQATEEEHSPTVDLQDSIPEHNPMTGIPIGVPETGLAEALAEVKAERDALRQQVDEKDAQNAKLRASLEAKVAENK